MFISLFFNNYYKGSIVIGLYAKSLEYNRLSAEKIKQFETGYLFTKSLGFPRKDLFLE